MTVDRTPLCSEQGSEVTGFYRQKSRDIQKIKVTWSNIWFQEESSIGLKTKVKAFQENIYIFRKLVMLGPFIQ